MLSLLRCFKRIFEAWVFFYNFFSRFKQTHAAGKRHHNGERFVGLDARTFHSLISTQFLALPADRKGWVCAELCYELCYSPGDRAGHTSNILKARSAQIHKELDMCLLGVKFSDLAMLDKIKRILHHQIN